MQLLNIGGDMHALDGGDVRDAARLQPIEKLDGSARIGAARVRVADVGGEEFKEAIGGALAGDRDQSRRIPATVGARVFMKRSCRMPRQPLAGGDAKIRGLDAPWA